MLLQQWTCLEHGFNILTSDLDSVYQPSDAEDECSPWLRYYHPDPKACRFSPPGVIDTDNLPAPDSTEYRKVIEELEDQADEASRRKGFDH